MGDRGTKVKDLSGTNHLAPGRVRGSKKNKLFPASSRTKELLDINAKHNEMKKRTEDKKEV